MSWVDVVKEEKIKELQVPFENYAECLIFVDFDGKIIKMNRSLCEYSGSPPCCIFDKEKTHCKTSYEGKSIWEISEDIKKENWDKFVSFLEEHKVVVRESLYLSEGDHEKIIPVEEYVYCSEDYILFSLKSLLRRKNIENKIKKITKRLVESNKDLENFAYIASHDLQEPLRKIKQFGKFLKEENEKRLDKNGKIYLNKMISSAERMEDFVDKLLEYSRVGKNTEEKDIDLNELVAEIKLDLELFIKRNKAKITCTNMPKMRSSKMLMKQLFQNLITNSIRFKREKCNPVINISYKKNENFFEILVSDNGIGINEKINGKIFDIFFSNNKKNLGNGLGLAICKKIVNRYDGIITAKNNKKNGTRFEIKFPIEMLIEGE